jgi:formylglycine-generating enzyme required for sulfatase activity
LRIEFEEAQRRADEARQRADEAARRRAEEEAARKRAEEEAARKLAEEEAARRRAEEAARKQAEEEAERKRAEEEEAARLAAEEARKRAEEENARKRAAEEAARLAQEVAEAKRRAEEARLLAEAEARRRTEEEAARLRAEEKARQLAAEVEAVQRRAEESRQRAEEEARKRAEQEEARKLAEAEIARERAEAAARVQAEEDAKRRIASDEADRLAREVAEAQQRAEEARQRAEEEAHKRAQEEEARKRAEAEARRLALEVAEAQRRAEEAARKRAEEAEAQRRAEEAARRRAEEEQQRIAAELEAKRKAEEHAAKERQRLTRANEQQPVEHAATTQLTETLVLSPEATQEERQTGLLPSAENATSTGTSPTISLDTGPTSHEGVTWQQSQPSVDVSLPALEDSKVNRRSILPMVVGVVIGLVVIAFGGLMIFLFAWNKQAAKPAGSTVTTASPVPDRSDQQPSPKNEMVKIEGGTFLMGRNDVPMDSPLAFDLNQYPAHSVNVDSFWIDKTEVTNAEYENFVRETKYAPPSYWSNAKPPQNQELWPVTSVSLDDANAFAAWRSKRDGVTYRLPEEKEWEYAARNGSSNMLYPWGNSWLDDRANVDGKSLKPVGSYPRGVSSKGVLDLIGNAWEWTATKYAPYEGNSRLPPSEGGEYVIRGGAFQDTGRGSKAITATRRSKVIPSTKDDKLGFRLVRDDR